MTYPTWGKVEAGEELNRFIAERLGQNILWPRYSEQLTAAWQLIPTDIEYRFELVRPEYGDRWEATIWHVQRHTKWSASHESPEMAICWAWLSWKETN